MGRADRLPDLDPEGYTEAQASLHEALATRPEVAAHGLVGPFAVWMHAPELGRALASVGAAVRFGASLPANATEVAICTTGAHHRARFEFAAHRPLAVAAGVAPGALDRLAAGDDPGFEGDEATAHRVATELLRHGTVAEPTYREAEARFGPQGVVELVTTVGYYGLICLQLNAFDVALSPGMDDPFPEG